MDRNSSESSEVTKAPSKPKTARHRCIADFDGMHCVICGEPL